MGPGRRRSDMMIKGALTMCNHDPYIILSNQVKMCLLCYKLIIPERLKEVYDGPGYENKVEVKEEPCKP
jgi:hypothetical protein